MRQHMNALIAEIAIPMIISAALTVQTTGLSPGLIRAPTNCPNIVKAALAVTNNQCARTGRNKACYGNNSATVEPQAGVTNLNFSNPGDIADLQAIRTLHLSGMDAATNQWGVALMRIQADLPDTSPQDNVTLLLFGNVDLTDASPQASAVRPTQTAELLNGQLSATPSETVLLTATPAAESNATVTAEPSPAYIYKPMQAFYFKSGAGTSPCAEAPPDGILIQSPRGKQKVELSVDGVRLQLGSTVFLTAQPSGELVVKTIEGSVQVEAAGKQVTIPAGTQSAVKLDSNLNVTGAPGLPEPYGLPKVSVLPVRNLPIVVPIAQPLVPNLGSGSFTCSIRGTTAATIMITNNRNRAVSVYWVDYQCKEELYQTIQPGGSYTQDTFVTHPWRIRDAADQTLLAQFVADGKLSAVSVP